MAIMKNPGYTGEVMREVVRFKALLVAAASALAVLGHAAWTCAQSAAAPLRSAAARAQAAVEKTVVRAKPQIRAPQRAGDGAAPAAGRSTADAGGFDMKALIARLKATPAIGFFSKLAIRSEALDLLDMVKAYRRHAAAYSLQELRARFDGLVLKILALLDGDPKLARDIYLARERIWKSLMEVKA